MNPRIDSHQASFDAGDPAATACATRSAQDLPLVHPAYLRLLVAAATAEGIDLSRRLIASGLDPATLHERDEPMPLATWRRVLLDLQLQAWRPGLAIRLGRKVPLLAHGPLAYLMASSRDLRQALHALVRFAPLRLAVLELRLNDGAQGVELHANARVALGDVERFTLDFLWAMLSTMLDELCPGARRAMTLQLAGTRADAAAVWAEHGITVGRSAGGSFLLLPHALADSALATASAAEHRRAWRACEEAESQQGWAKSMVALVEQLFRTGAAASYHLGWIAARLGMSRRTVMRRLSNEGTQFSALVEASRKERLLRRLAERQLTLGEIAVDLGYADGSAFNRAVQRWFGIGPRALQHALTSRGSDPGAQRATAPVAPKDKSLAPMD